MHTLNKKENQFVQISKKKKKIAQRQNSKIGKRPRLYTEKFKSIHGGREFMS